MDFETCISTAPTALMEGALGERLKREFGLDTDGAAELHSSPTEELAASMMKLRSDFGLRIFGGCCGTDGKHLAEIARRLGRADGDSDEKS